MSYLKNTFCAAAVIALIGFANAMCTNVGEYAAPTPSEVENDIQTQRTQLCNAEGWPDDADAKLAYERACKGELRRKST